jgi:hypothetical protein
MSDLRSTVGAINKKKKSWDDPFGDNVAPPAVRSAPPPKADEDDLLSDAAIDAEMKRRKAAQPKKGWLW